MEGWSVKNFWLSEDEGRVSKNLTEDLHFLAYFIKRWHFCVLFLLQKIKRSVSRMPIKNNQ